MRKSESSVRPHCERARTSPHSFSRPPTQTQNKHQPKSFTWVDKPHSLKFAPICAGFVANSLSHYFVRVSYVLDQSYPMPNPCGFREQPLCPSLPVWVFLDTEICDCKAAWASRAAELPRRRRPLRPPPLLKLQALALVTGDPRRALGS